MDWTAGFCIGLIHVDTDVGISSFSNSSGHCGQTLTPSAPLLKCPLNFRTLTLSPESFSFTTLTKKPTDNLEVFHQKHRAVALNTPQNKIFQ